MNPRPRSQADGTGGHISSAAWWLGLLLASVGHAGETPRAMTGPRETPRLGFSNSMFAGVNENDAKASIKALATTMLRDRGLPADPEPLLFNGTAAVATAVRAGTADAVGLTSEEYWVLAREVRFDRFVMAVKNDDPTERYLLLLNRASGVSGLTGLRGKHLSVFLNPRMSLDRVWLEVLLAQAGLPMIAGHFGGAIDQARLSKAVLDVFFRQADACLVTRRGFATLVELNPQVGTQLVVLASSLPLVPALFAFRAGFLPSLKERSVHEMGLVHTSTAGQQARLIFQVGQVSKRPAADLDSALALLAGYTRRKPAAHAARIGAIQGQGHAKPGGAPS